MPPNGQNKHGRSSASQSHDEHLELNDYSGAVYNEYVSHIAEPSTIEYYQKFLHHLHDAMRWKLKDLWATSQ
ncbi:hypothetical protein TNCV_4776421 [Trichonephila clavipes]|nr:hypothetical protein TNCV_4776421 [Trichonephila clavipes]